MTPDDTMFLTLTCTLAFALTVGAERFAARWWLGAGLILAALVLVERRPSRAPEPAP